MNAVQILASLGFTNATEIEQKRGLVLVRIRTSHGWTYERFRLSELQSDIEKWSVGRSPE